MPEPQQGARGAVQVKPTQQGEVISIAILPPENASGDPVDAHLCRAIADDLTSGLCRFRELAVIARPSAIKFADHALSIQYIVRFLAPPYLLVASGRASCRY